MLLSEIKIGDEVRIRDWSDMAAEYPHDDYEILLEDDDCVFVSDMDDLCGRVFVVAEICDRYGMEGKQVLLDDPDGDSDVNEWTITAGMLEPVKSEPEVSKDELIALIGGAYD